MKKRKVYYDFLRILAAFLVIFNHIPGYTLYQISGGGIKTWIYTFITMFTRINVPIFFMITGALLLGRDEEIGEIFKKRISRMVSVLLIFGAVASWVKGFPDLRFDVARYCNELITGNITVAYWFLYAYISFLLLLPYIRRVARTFSERDFLYYVLLRFLICSLVPIVNYLLFANGQEKIAITGNLNFCFMVERILFYPVIGYYLDCKVDLHQMKRKQWVYIALLAVIGILTESAITIHEGITTGTYTQAYVMLFDYVIAIFVFLGVKYLFECKGFLAKREKISNMICKVGTLTLGMYVMDPIWRMLFVARVNAFLEPYLPTLIVSGIYCVFSMCLSGILTWILKKVPGVKRIL